jgi:flagellar hook-basal body complex protein FliE
MTSTSLPSLATSFRNPVNWPSFATPAAGGPATAGAAPQVDFQQLLGDALSQVRSAGQESQAAVRNSLLSDEMTLVETFSTMREADLALKLTMQLRNKLIEAYQELQNLRF